MSPTPYLRKPSFLQPMPTEWISVQNLKLYFLRNWVHILQHPSCCCCCSVLAKYHRSTEQGIGQANVITPVAHGVLSQMPVRKKQVLWELGDYLADEKDVTFGHLLDRDLVLSVLTRKSNGKNFFEGSMLNARIRICSLTDAPLVAHAFRLVIWKKAIQKLAKKNLRKHLSYALSGNRFTVNRALQVTTVSTLLLCSVRIVWKMIKGNPGL